MQFYSMRPVSIVLWTNGKIVKGSNQSQKRNKWKQGIIDWNGVRLQANIVAWDVEETVTKTQKY